MKRTDLIELAERLAYESDFDAQERAADFLRQIAQAQPVAWEGQMRLRWRQQSLSMTPLYRLPLED